VEPILHARIVLLVEDNPGDARLIAESLRDSGSTVQLVTVETLSDALTSLASTAADAVLLDLGLPDSDGLRTFTRLQEAAPRVATIILSGNGDPRTALEAVQKGAQDFIVKGRVDGESLVRSIGYAIERKASEWSLRESEERLHRAIEDAPIPIAIHAEDGEFIELNHVWEELSGYAREQIPTMQEWTKLAYGDQAESVLADIARLYSLDEREEEGEYEVHTADGSVRVWDYSSAPLGRLPDGRRIVMTTARDVTARRRAEEKLRASEEGLRRNLEISDALAELSRILMAERRSIEQNAKLKLRYAMELTGSEHGYVSYVEGVTGANVILAASEMYPGGSADEDDKRRATFPLPKAGKYRGLWGESLNTGLPFLTNDPSAEGDAVGVPLGHATLRCFLSAPAITARGIIGQIAVANAPGGYGDRDIGVLERLASLFAVSLERSASEDALLRSDADLRSSNYRLQRMVTEVAEAMGSIVETRDPYTQGHQVRVARIAVALGTDMGLDAEALAALRMAGLLHDLGKLKIPAEILSKPGTLSEVEFDLIKEHPVDGHAILAKIDFPWPIADYVLQHHERQDGSGYPGGLSGDDILMPARILAVADVLEAMSSFRPYRAALGAQAAVAEIVGHPEKYDTDAVRAMISLHERSELGI
jgi:PAS domain S-box-containing protein/putative nucleotidyltransferase with HDIG domain